MPCRLRTFLKENGKFLCMQRYFAGSAYTGLGLATALSGSQHKELGIIKRRVLWMKLHG